MASTSEVGHNKNVANFNSGYQILEEMGLLYNPSNVKIKLQNLDPLRATLQTTITVLNQKIPLYKNTVAAREQAFAPISKLMTRVVSNVKSLELSDTEKENIATQVKKIRGDQKVKKVNPETSETETISTSQMSYDNRISNLDVLINQLSSHPQYAPNEIDLQIVTLQTLKTNLQTLSSSVNTAGNAIITARTNRNNALYNSENNIIKLVKDIKSYLKSLGDSGKPYYNAFVLLKFKDKK
jgi:copper chaperone CopZ